MAEHKKVEEMGKRSCEEHLEAGGEFSLRGGVMRVVAIPGPQPRYVLLNDSGNGGEHVVPRILTMLDFMEQYGGSLDAWEVVDPAAASIKLQAKPSTEASDHGSG